MSKSVLVTDTPENCGKCKFISEFWCRAMNSRRVPNNDVIPDWCPLKLLPEKKSTTAPVSNYEVQKNLFADGWNACLREITKTSDENER